MKSSVLWAAVVLAGGGFLGWLAESGRLAQALPQEKTQAPAPGGASEKTQPDRRSWSGRTLCSS